MKEKIMIIAKISYREYKKHSPDALEWDELSKDQQEGFVAAMYHKLRCINAIPLRVKFNLGVD